MMCLQKICRIFGQELFNAFGKVQSGEEMTDIEQRLLAAKQKAMDALTAADVVVFAFPLWNLTIPAKLQTFIDYVYQAGFTFKYDENGQAVQLMTDKKADYSKCTWWHLLNTGSSTNGNGCKLY